MGRPKDTTSTTRGKNRLREFTEPNVTSMIKELKQLKRYCEDHPDNIDKLIRLIELRQGVLRYQKPQLAAIAPGELTNEGDVDPLEARKFYEALKANEQNLLKAQESNATSCEIITDALIQPVSDAAFSQEQDTAQEEP